ncbi:hypothetical protein BD779DRAFT_1610624 [Infundibulicybe gibba]|nr:hypothetical protein BD779DRAFT_1610624 [Infundibulicybe gibba]
MSAFARILRPIPASRRNYSFFSSKSGGGRYFNSSKPPKAIVPGNSTPTTTTTTTSPKVDPTIDSKDASSVGNVNNATREEQRPSSGSNPSSGADINPPSQMRHLHIPSSHPVVNPKDFKLHQFFSLHRPLLLLSNPSSILETATSVGPLFTQALPSGELDLAGHEPPAPTNNFEDFGNSSFDADAEAARQLTRALTMNRAGATIAWEDTLRRLGLDVNKDVDRIGLQQQWDREWEEVRMDSVQRKRRKKMKKHKLKKRRKATRATRLKIGR